MTVPSWRDESGSKSSNGKARRPKPRRSRSGRSTIEQLEARQLMTVSSTLTGSTADFSVATTTDSVAFSQSGGLLEHNALTAPAGQSFADDFDFDSTVAGSQHLAAVSGSQVEIGNVNSNPYNVTIGTPSSPASTVLSQFILYGNLGSSAAIDDSGSSTANTFTETVSSISGTGVQASILGSAFSNGVSLTTGSAQDTINVQSTDPGEPRTLLGAGGDIVNVGDGTIDLTTHIQGPLNVDGTGSLLTVTPLTSSGGNVTLSGTTLSGLTAVAAPIGFANLGSLSIVGGNGANSFDVTNTPTAPTVISTGTGTTPVSVLADSGTLSLTNPGGADTVDIGNAGTLSGVTKAVTVSNSGGSTAVTINDSADTSSTNATLISTGANTATLTGLGIAPIILGTNNGEVASILSGTGSDTQTVDFSAGNPIPNGLTYTGGGGFNTLILQGALPGGPFAAETYNATGAGAGTINLGGSSVITFSGLKPVIDTTPATNYAVNYTGGQDARISITAGAVADGFSTTLVTGFATVSQFERVSYANKTNVTINTGTGNDVVDLTGSALLPGSNTTINGQTGTNTLNYDAGGEAIVIAPVTGNPGAATISRPGSGTLLVENFQNINVVNGTVAGIPVVNLALVSAAGVRGFVGAPLTNVDVATFTSLDPTATAASFGASITWGDGSTTAGTVVADASNPTIFHVEGNHTYTSPSPVGGYPVAVSVSQTQTNTTIDPGITITQNTPNNATVAPAFIEGLSNASPATTITGATEGASFTGTIASFSDNAVVPASSPAQYNATINWGDGQSSTGIITASATAGEFDVAGTHIYPKAGSFTPTVTIMDTLAPTGSPITVVRDLTVAIASISGVALPDPAFTATVNTPFTGVFGAFTSANPFATASDFAATVNYPGGLTSPGIVTENSSGVFSVTGTTTFNESSGVGTDGVSVTVTEDGLTPTVFNAIGSEGTVLDAPLTAQGTTISAVAGVAQSPVQVASFTYGLGGVPATNFSGSINWGDGTITPFASGEGITLVGNASNSSSFVVTGTHTYATFGTFATSVTINSEGGSTAIATGSATVADAPIIASGSTIEAFEADPIVSGQIGTFTTTNLSAVGSDFLVTINWGDGTTSTGSASSLIVPIPVAGTDAFAILGSHTYTQVGTYSPVATIRDTGAAGGSTATAVGSVVVSAVPLTPQQGNFFEATDRVPFTTFVGKFGSANPSATVSEFTAEINWGDGSAPSAGTITLGNNGAFEVTGSHTYVSPANNTNPFQVTTEIQELGSTDIAATIHGTAIVFDAPLTAQGATVTAVAGSPLIQDLVASFNYGGGDVPTSNFSGTINWGDGTTSPLTSAEITDIQPPTVNQAYTINATHTYASQGTYPVSITINSAGGSSAVSNGTAIVADALLVTVTPIAITAGVPISNEIIATIADSGTLAPVTKYAATINWGDGTPPSAGTIVVGSNGVLDVLGSHTYASGGPYIVSVTATNDLGGITTGTNLFFVGAAPVVPINLTGALDEASDSGVSDTDAITNDTTPHFFGSATPGTLVYLYAIPVGTNIPVPIGQGVTDATGAWSITSIKLADGRYNVEAIGISPTGTTSVLDVLLPNALQGPLVIDTVAPKVTNVQFEPLTGRVLVTFQDNSSGLDEGSIIDGGNYAFSFVGPIPGIAKSVAAAEKAKPDIVSGVNTTPQLVATDPQTVVVTIDNNQPIRGGLYRITILSGGIEDLAGNALDGTFYGYFPSGKNSPGGNFVANLDSVHNTVLPPLPVSSTASPLANKGILPTKVFIPTVNPTRIRIVSGAQQLNALPGQYFPGTYDPTTTAAAHDAAISQVSVKKAAKPKA